MYVYHLISYLVSLSAANLRTQHCERRLRDTAGYVCQVLHQGRRTAAAQEEDTRSPPRSRAHLQADHQVPGEIDDDANGEQERQSNSVCFFVAL